MCDSSNLDRFFEKLTNIEKRLDEMEGKIEFITHSSYKMNNHISFIEKVYDTVKTPFFYIINKIQPINTKELEGNEMKLRLKNDD